MDLFEKSTPTPQQILPDVWLIKGLLANNEAVILQDVHGVIAQAPLRHMMTKMGFSMSAAMTNCGELGWISDRKGYRYDVLDPLTNQRWPQMPVSFFDLARQAASLAGFNQFVPDACLINQYKVGASMGLHQDKNEQDLSQPIVSVSLGIPAVFQFSGLQRTGKATKIPLAHGDIIVWGGESRLNFHGILPLKTNIHPNWGAYRYNLTFRKAGS